MRRLFTLLIFTLAAGLSAKAQSTIGMGSPSSEPMQPSASVTGRQTNYVVSSTDSSSWSIQLNSTSAEPSIALRGTDSVTIDWGDGTQIETQALSSTSDSTVSHTYAAAGTYTMVIYNSNAITKWSTSSSCSWSFGLASIPRSMTYFRCAGANTITGPLSALPSTLTDFICGGSNTISGNLADLPGALTYFALLGAGNNTVDSYTAGHAWPAQMRSLYITSQAGGLTAAMVDSLFIDLDATTWHSGGAAISLTGPGVAVPTSASSAARQDLSQNKGVTITTDSYNWTANVNTTSANPFIVVQGVGTMSIDWGDGTSQQAVTLSSGDKTVTHTYSSPGIYTVTFHDADNLTKFWAYGACSWSYNLSSVPSGLKYLAMTGPSNTVTGNLSALPSGLDTLMLGRSNTVTGSYASLPRGLLMYYNKGISGSVTGNLSDLPRGLTYFLDWSSANPGPTGDIANLPSGLTFCDFETPHNTSYGDIGRLPAGLTYFNDQGYNTTSGNIAGLPSGIRVFIDYGSNTTTGDLSGIPANDSLFFDTGNNTVTGDLASVPVSVSSFELGGNNTVTGYTAPHMWNPDLYLFLYFHYGSSSGGLTASEVDSLFIDMDKCNWSGQTADGITRKLTVCGSLSSVAGPTAVSYAAREDLTANKGVIISTNASSWSVGINTASANPAIILQGKDSVQINWGDGSANQTIALTGSDQTASHTYSTAGNHNITFYAANNLTKFSTASNCDWSFDLASIPKGLTYFDCSGTNTITGGLSSLPGGMAYFDCSGSNTITGNLSGLPRGMTNFTCSGSNTVAGNLSSLPTGLASFNCQGNNTVAGNLSSLPTGLTYFSCRGNNTITGDLSSLPSGIATFNCVGNNTINSCAASHAWASGMNEFCLTTNGKGLTSWMVDSLFILLDKTTWHSGGTINLTGTGIGAPTPASAAARTDLTINKHVSITTNSSIWSMNINTSTANPSMLLQGTDTLRIDWGDGSAQQVVALTSSDQTVTHSYSAAGNYTVKFDGANNLTKFSTNSNCNWSLDLSSIPSGLTQFVCTGSDTITGNLSSLPAGLTTFDCQGSNTITGNLSSLPAGLSTFVCQGNNTITGNLSTLPAGMLSFDCQGKNTITGSLSNLPSRLVDFHSAGNNTIDSYTAGRTWASPMAELNLSTSNGGLTSSMVDSLFIDLDHTTWSTGGTIVLKGSGIGPATSVSAAARADLTTNKHVIITCSIDSSATDSSSTTGSVSTWSVHISTAAANPSFVIQGTETMSIDWGDGSARQVVVMTASDQTLTHTYTAAGTYTVTFYNPDYLTKFMAYGLCSWSFDLSSVPASLKSLAMTGSNTVTGNVSTLPSGLDTLVLYGSNTVTGVYASLPRGLVKYDNKSLSNTVTGNLSDLPRGLAYFADYSNANPGPTGDIANLPSGLTYCDLEASHNSSYGDISQLPTGLTYFNDQGTNTTSGNISGLPSGLRVFIDYGSNTTTGNLSGIPSSDSLFFDTGNNTIDGNLASVPSSVSSFELGGKNTVTGYTAPHTWNADTYLFLLTLNNGGLTSAEVDSLFIDLDKCNWTGKTCEGIGEEITVTGQAVAAPTSASSVARTDLATNKHITIVVPSLESAESGPATPGSFSLYQNYPNPFNPSTIISYQLPKSSLVTLVVYDVLGRKVRELVNRAEQPGKYSVTFDAEGLPSGVYFYRLLAGNFTQTRRLMLLR